MQTPWEAGGKGQESDNSYSREKATSKGPRDHGAYGRSPYILPHSTSDLPYTHTKHLSNAFLWGQIPTCLSSGRHLKNKSQVYEPKGILEEESLAGRASFFLFFIFFCLWHPWQMLPANPKCYLRVTPDIINSPSPPELTFGIKLTCFLCSYFLG